MTNFGRKPIEAIEIDLDRCTRTYGSAPCAAALDSDNPHKCFNTRGTCQDPANFNKGTLTLRYVQNRDGLPKGDEFYPALLSVSTAAAEANLTGNFERSGPLGSMGQITASLQDFPDRGYFWDPYHLERMDGTAQTTGAYDPLDFGTHFSKFREVHKYIVGRPMRRLRGYVGDDWADMRTEHYFISEMSGPDSSGRASIIGRDVFDVFDGDTFEYPARSTGTLAADIGLSDTTFEVNGDMEEYEASGRVAIGSEIIQYERSGSTFTVIARGADGTEASTHSEDDAVQFAPRFENARIIDVAQTIILASGVESSVIPFSDWEAEAARWQTSFRVTRTLHEPVGGNKLLGELAVFGCIWWWSMEAREIKFWPAQPLSPDAVARTFRSAFTDPDDAHIIEESVSITYAEEHRLSDVVMHHGVIDPTQGDKEVLNYRQVNTARNLSKSTDDTHGSPKIRTIFTKWLGNDGDTKLARTAVGRMLARYVETPVIIEFDLDVKDQADVNLTDFIKTETFRRTAGTGFPIIDQMQVMMREEIENGHRLRVRAISYKFDSRFSYMTEDARPDYSASTDAQKAFGCYMSDGENKFSDGGDPYRMF